MKPESNLTLHLKLSSTDQKLLSVASCLAGCESVSEFVIQSALNQANEICKNRSTFRLSHDDAAVFSYVLDEPHKPNKRFQMAVSEHNKVLGKG
ncbi:DUF1778 domain-containing protein [Ferrimonas lipolytica]|uniref:DUF1778 domain-containing protein n=1 Tax=Ferrimonas lipolytica TaxID=2724191 RepID=A0A6H1UDB1_9GAMM|nr:DUF1778 domain-containing protein [Ferrimonas lipolytica]